MGFLIKKSDKNAFNKVEYVKNATFWKDLLAFYDAYTLLTSRTKNELPNFCFESNRLSLDGLCLLIKDSTALFAFSSLNPSIDYLKLLYYSMASYSKNGELPQRTLISADYNKYRIACKSAMEKSKELVGANDLKQQKVNERFQTQNDNVKNLGKKVKTANLFLIFSILFIGLGIAIYFVGDNLLSTISNLKMIFTTTFIILGTILLILSIILRIKYAKAYKTEKGYSNNFISKQNLNSQTNNLSKEKNIVYKLYSEYYEYRNNLSQSIYDKSSTNFLMALNTIKRNQELYQNNEILTIAEAHTNDAKQIFDSLNAGTPNFNEIYSKITQKNWLYYSCLVRYKFITEFAKTAILSHDWQVKLDEQKQHPFNIDVKKLVNEKVMFLPNDGRELYCLPVEEILKSSLLKTYKLQDFTKVTDNREFRYHKMQYMTSFYNSQKFENQSGGVYKMKLRDNENYGDSAMQKYSKIPTLFEMEEKLQNLELNLENSSEKSINRTLAEIYGNMLGFDDDYISSVLPENAIESEDLLTADNELDDIEEINGHTAVCTFGDKKVIGFKIED